MIPDSRLVPKMFRYPLVLLCTILLVLQHVEGITFQPRNERSMPARRQNAVCEPAVLGVSEDAVSFILSPESVAFT